MTTAANNTLILTWFNARDVRSEELNHNTERMTAIGKTVENSANQIGCVFSDIVAIGEVAYDLPSVPTPECTSTGENLSKLAKNFPREGGTIIFPMGNIGLQAKPTPTGDYLISREDTEKVNTYGDLVNYGLFPGQYNTGAVSYTPTKSFRVIKKVKWIDFNPHINPSTWKDASGKPIPEGCQLFDKCFIDISLTLNGNDLHLLILHTVPASGFGNAETPNLQRNKDQLAFLQWYLSGSTYFDVQNTLYEDGEPITPLSERNITHIIAMGDWNADPTDETCPGSEILRSLFDQFDFFPQEGITEKSADGSFQGRLDCILWTKAIKCLATNKQKINEKVSDHTALSVKVTT